MSIQSVSPGEMRRAMSVVVPEVPSLLRRPIAHVRQGDHYVVHALADELGVPYQRRTPIEKHSWDKLETYTLTAATTQPVTDALITGSGYEANFQDTEYMDDKGVKIALQETVLTLTKELPWMRHLRSLVNTKLRGYIFRNYPDSEKKDVLPELISTPFVEPEVRSLITLVAKADGYGFKTGVKPSFDACVAVADKRRRILHDLSYLISARAGLHVDAMDDISVPLENLKGDIVERQMPHPDGSTTPRAFFRSTDNGQWAKVFPSTPKDAGTPQLKCPFSQAQAEGDPAVKTFVHAQINYLTDMGRAYVFDNPEAGAMRNHINSVRYPLMEQLGKYAPSYEDVSRSETQAARARLAQQTLL